MKFSRGAKELAISPRHPDISANPLLRIAVPGAAAEGAPAVQAKGRWGHSLQGLHSVWL